MPASRLSWIPQATVFTSSFCIMVIELVAGRIVSRHLGSSLYTWTSVIGIVLAGIALGNWIGGRLADKREAAPTLSTLFLTSSATCVLLLVLNHIVGDLTLLWGLPWPLRVGAHVTFVFIIPSVVLGMISPVAAKMALDQSQETGRTIGTVYAWGVIGSIGGTFATGFWLIAAFGTQAVVWGVAGVLAAVGLFYRTRPKGWMAVLAIAGAATVGLGPWAWAESLGEQLKLRSSPADDVIWSKESQYSHVRVHEVSPGVRNMHLDKLLHSTIVLSDPDDLQYPYERVYAAVTHSLMADRDSLATLTIGGGGYVFPRYLESNFPGSRTEVVEIDPVVTQAALEAFGLSPDHRMVIAHEDGRAYLHRRARESRGTAAFDLIYLDVFDDYSVPYQLTTRECLQEVDALLAPDGAYLMNMIDIYSEGYFLGAMIATLREVFADVAVFSEGSAVSRDPESRRTFILAAGKQPLELHDVQSLYGREKPLSRLTDQEISSLLARRGRVLTDDWSPVENLLAPVVMRSSRGIAAGLYLGRARAALNESDFDEARQQAARALKLTPQNEAALEISAFAAMNRKDWIEAVELLQHVLAMNPARTKARVDLATALARSGRVREGVAQLEEAIRLDPNSAIAWRNLGVMLQGLGEEERAGQAKRRAEELGARI